MTKIFKRLPLLVVCFLVLIAGGSAIIDGANLLGISNDTAELARGGFILTVLRALIGLAFIFAVLRIFDMTMGYEFGDWIRSAGERSDYRSIAVYFGARFIGVALYVGIVFS